MNIYSILQLCGGLAFFLFGMHVMSGSLEKLAGGNLQKILKEVTSNPIKSLFFGAIVTIAIQSSSALTVMLVGLVNSGIMELAQTVGVIMGSNIGTTLTAWILSLSGIESDNLFISMLKPENFSPVIALIGVIMIMGSKKEKRKDVGIIMAGFAVLMYGMQLMSGAVSPLADMPEFTGLLTTFNNPFLGVLVGAVFTGVIQSSAASVGVLQALAMTGAISYSMAIPIIMGQNIGTCVTALLSAVGASKNAKRAAVVHLLFNIIGTTIFMVVFYSVNSVVHFEFLGEAANKAGIAVVHTVFNVAATIVLLPFSNLLEKLSYMVIQVDEEERKQAKQQADFVRMDERFLNTPSFALEQAYSYVVKMAEITKASLQEAMGLFITFDKEIAADVEFKENLVDQYDDEISGYLVKLSSRNLSEKDSKKMTMLMHSIGDFERISDHAINLVDAAREMQKKEQTFSSKALEELETFSRAVSDIVDMSVNIFEKEDVEEAKHVEPFEEAIDVIQKEMKKRHSKRLRKGKCTVELGFVLSDITNNYERIADHCSNIAISVMQLKEDETHAHEYVDTLPKGEGSEFDIRLQSYLRKYELP